MSTTIARIGYEITSLASLVFAASYLMAEVKSPGLGFGVRLIAMPMLLTLFGFAKISDDGISQDGKGAGWISAIVAFAGVGYMSTFFTNWYAIAIMWLLSHSLVGVANIVTPTSRD